MNVHFLELFYYVAKHGGISAAVRHIPYGIQQPAVSTQVGKLERDLGVRLFERTPFRLTRAGAVLYEFVAPFFEQMEAVASKVKSAEQTELRVGGAEMVLRDYLPVVLRKVKKEFPEIRFSLRALGFLAESETWLQKGELDLAFLPLGPRAAAPLKQRAIVRLPLALQVPAKSNFVFADPFWSKKKISLPLISLPASSWLSRTFQDELRRRRVHWPQTIEASSLDLVTRYVANGDGIGLTVAIPANLQDREVRIIPLEDFPRITMGAVWSGQLSPAAKRTIDHIQSHAEKIWPEEVVSAPERKTG